MLSRECQIFIDIYMGSNPMYNDGGNNAVNQFSLPNLAHSLTPYQLNWLFVIDNNFLLSRMSHISQ